MLIGDRLRAMREQKNFSQGDIEKRTGLFRCYISRVENGHTLPVLGTLEKFAKALEIPLYQLLYDGEEPPKPAASGQAQKADWASSGAGARLFHRLQGLLGQMKQADRKLILQMAQGMASRKR